MQKVKNLEKHDKFLNIINQLKSNEFWVSLAFEYDSNKSVNTDHQYSILFNKNNKSLIKEKDKYMIDFWYLKNYDYLTFLQGAGSYKDLKNPEENQFIKKYSEEIKKSINLINNFFFKDNEIKIDENKLNVI